MLLPSPVLCLGSLDCMLQVHLPSSSLCLDTYQLSSVSMRRYVGWKRVRQIQMILSGEARRPRQVVKVLNSEGKVVAYAKPRYPMDASKIVFHIVADTLNYAAMRMRFLVNPPGKATIQVQNIEDFTWRNASYSPVLKQLPSPAMIVITSKIMEQLLIQTSSSKSQSIYLS